MSGRPLISYDDITLPYDAQQPSGPPPAKKAKKANGGNTTRVNHAQATTHWDDPKALPSSSNSAANSKNSTTKPFIKPSASGKSKGGPSSRSVHEESRELTHEEIWDDSALVDAWDAAMEEYEAFNGPDKSWKNEPVFKSPLWYNVPPSSRPSKSDRPTQDNANPSSSALPDAVDEEEGGYEDDEYYGEANEHPPDNDDGQTAPQWPGYSSAYYDLENSPSFMSTVSQDEAFSRALNAMYWGGYWTAMYHCQRDFAKKRKQPPTADENDKGEEEGIDANDDGEDENSGMVTS